MSFLPNLKKATTRYDRGLQKIAKTKLTIPKISKFWFSNACIVWRSLLFLYMRHNREVLDRLYSWSSESANIFPRRWHLTRLPVISMSLIIRNSRFHEFYWKRSTRFESHWTSTLTYSSRVGISHAVELVLDDGFLGFCFAFFFDSKSHLAIHFLRSMSRPILKPIIIPRLIPIAIPVPVFDLASMGGICDISIGQCSINFLIPKRAPSFTKGSEIDD